MKWLLFIGGLKSITPRVFAPVKPVSQDHVRFGAAVRQRREELGMSQDDFALHAGIHRTYVGGVERGERNLTLEKLLQFAASLGLRGSELLARAERLER